MSYRYRDVNAILLGTILLHGRGWTRDQCHIIYRGRDGALDYEKAQGVMELADERVNVAAQELPANSVWHYERRQVSCCGLESPDSDLCIIQIDENGDMYLPSPNVQGDQTVEQLAGGAFKVRWSYLSDSEAMQPSRFNIYIDSGSGFDFASPAGYVVWRGDGEYYWDSGSFAHGTLCRFVVRSVAAVTLAESQNTRYVSAVADDLGPAAITSGVAASWETIP